jgi:hypothetical protein
MKSFFIQIFTVFLFFNNGPTINAASERTDSEQWQSDHDFERWKTTLSTERFQYIPSYLDDIPEFAAFADRKDPIPTAPESVALQPAGSKRTLDEEDDDYDDYNDAQVAPTSSSSSSSSATGSRRGQADFTEKRYGQYLAKSRDDKPLTFEQWQKKLLAVRQRRELQKQKSIGQRSVKRRRKVKKGPSEHELMDALDEEPKYSDIDIEYVLSTAKTTNTPFHKALILKHIDSYVTEHKDIPVLATMRPTDLTKYKKFIRTASTYDLVSITEWMKTNTRNAERGERGERG